MTISTESTEEMINKIVALVAAKHNVIIAKDDPILLTLITNHEVLQLMIEQVLYANTIIRTDLEKFEELVNKLNESNEKLAISLQSAFSTAADKLLSDTTTVMNQTIKLIKEDQEANIKKSWWKR